MTPTTQAQQREINEHLENLISIICALKSGEITEGDIHRWSGSDDDTDEALISRYIAQGYSLVNIIEMYLKQYNYDVTFLPING